MNIRKIIYFLYQDNIRSQNVSTMSRWSRDIY